MYNLYKEYLEYFDLLDNQILLRSRDRKLEEANKKYTFILVADQFAKHATDD